jgi:hypothetical protein
MQSLADKLNETFGLEADETESSSHIVSPNMVRSDML